MFKSNLQLIGTVPGSPQGGSPRESAGFARPLALAELRGSYEDQCSSSMDVQGSPYNDDIKWKTSRLTFFAEMKSCVKI